MAGTLFGHPISAQLEDWWLRHGGRAGDAEWDAYVSDFAERFTVKVAEMKAEHENGGRFGMSKAGGCTRATSLKFLGEEAEPFTGSTQATFFIGHMVEVMAISGLVSIGLKVDGMQEPVRIDPFMHSYSDGIIEGIKGVKGQAILSVKSAGYKKSGKQGKGWVRRGFPALPFEGVRKQQPGWYAQVQAEMHGSGLGYALVSVCSKDIIKAMEGDPYLGEGGNGSLTFYNELIKYSPRFVDEHLLPVWEETWNTTQAGKPATAYYLAAERDEYVKLSPANESWLPNAGSTGTFNPCNYCDLLDACRARNASNWRNRG